MDFIYAMLLLHFNSIKVRLEPDSTDIELHHLIFQFHKGAIRTAEDGIKVLRVPAFQFHKGAIRTSNTASSA